MSNDARVRIFSKGSGSTVEGIKQSQFRKLSITFPVDIKEQSEINRMLNKLNYKINSECSYLDKVLKMKSALMQDLLTGKIMVS
jgi:restriction endonuclease S subunit